MEFPTGVKVPLQVSLSGDSVMVKSGQFSSQRRKKVKVWTEGAARMQGGKFVGETTAHYINAGRRLGAQAANRRQQDAVRRPSVGARFACNGRPTPTVVVSLPACHVER